MTEAPIAGIAGRRAIVTGAAGGIGRAVVDALRVAGAEVHGWDRAGVGVAVVDVADRSAVQNAWRTTEDACGPVDIVVQAAGVMTDDWNLCMAVNAGGVRNVVDVAVAAMTSRGRGCAVVVSSNAGATPRADLAPYAASKAAATSYARSVALAVAPAGVRVNIVSPGSTDTPMLRGMWSSDADEARVLAGTPNRFRLGIPLGRIADPADIAAAVVYLVSDAARHVTMHDLRVDGGATLDM
ncbi:SDR family oxidoreductase [Gordonia insulae]|uniref:2,3-dihydro-2,3-dihydroxybenzoate dehydrogenase n=1 Tax=Gordonia insulae TaxID=2420509 RepID=A0A3G8JJH8_9ACTN|nr:SDR family oxidoreductase [Gordonia insulae]AZG44370.1 2,3-dihydro-2,3-dihydroxybenzoate dehydrogenase [Gordonia insulae]